MAATHRRPRAATTATAAPTLATPSWDDLRYLLAVLRQRTFTAAAAVLATEQSTVSRRIAALEAELGVVLFERGRGAPVPTEAALRLRDGAERVEAELSRFRDDATGLRAAPVEGRVRLALTEELAVHVVVPEVLPALQAAHPALAVDLLTSYRAADLVGHEADIALRFFQTPRGDLVGRRIARMTTTVLGARAHARRLRATPLAELPWITVELGAVATPEAAWLDAAVGRPPALVCTSYQVQRAAIRAGLGVGIGPAVYARMDPDFVALPLALPPMPALELYLVTRRAIRTLPRVVAVLDALATAMARLDDDAAARPQSRRR